MERENKIKEKNPVKGVLKEHIQAAPKELVRRGLGDGADRLQTQLRDAAQDGRTDESGGDKLEDTAVGGLRRMEHGVERLLKQKKGRPAERRDTVGAESDSPAHSDAEHPRIKTREAVQAQPPLSTADRRELQGAAASRPIKTREAVQQAAPAEGKALHTEWTPPAARTKDAYIQRQSALSGAGTPQVAVGERDGAQGRAAAKEDALRRRGPTGAAVTEPAPQEVMPEGVRRPPSQYAIQPQKAVRENGASKVWNIRRLTDSTQAVRHSAPRPTVKGNLQAVKTAEHPIKAVGARPRGAGPTAQAVTRARQAASVRHSMSRTRQVASTRQAARTAGTDAKKAAQAAGRALRAILSAARSLAAAIAAGGGVVFMVILVICLIGFLAASPFGLFFSGENSGTGYTMPDAVVLLNGEFSNRIEQIKAANPYDTLDMDNAGSAAMISNWDDVLAVYAVRTSMSADAPEEVATLTEEKLSILREIFWDMNAISCWVEVIPGGEDEDDTTVLHITVTVKDYLQMADEYGFTAKQRELLAEMMGPEYQELFMALTGSYSNLTLTPEQVREIMKNLPANLSEERRQVVLTAYQLLGKVNYFWGGKSLVLGWDSRWGTPMEVWAEGSSTTGSVRPFGLDCSGMVDWVFYNTSGGEYILGHGGGASAQHSYCTEISWEEAIPGDLVFYPGDEHVGIVCGFDADGSILVIHCAYSANNVVVTGKSGFASIGSPAYFTD